VAERIAEIIVLAEDLRQFNLARRYLERNHNPGKIRAVLAPRGRGAGEQYVRDKYLAEVKEYRNRARRRKAALVVVTDADTDTVVERLNKLATMLQLAGERNRQPQEAIALLIPKRNIETWICCLLCDEVDETNDYKRREGIDRRIGTASATLYTWTRPNYVVPGKCVKSLLQAIQQELPRIE
jgi:hypothetical protein